MTEKKPSELLTKYGPWCLITGASSGIGLAYARFLASIGFDCILVSNDAARLADVQAELEGKKTGQVMSMVVDLSESDAVDQMVQEIEGLDIGLVINNAGYGLMGYFIQHPIASYRRMIRVNEEASISIMHRFCLHFYHAKRKGALITVTSVNADLLRGAPFSAVYSAGKSMLKNITEAVYYEMKPFGIDLLNVAPGPTDTSFQDAADTRRLFFMESPENVVRQSFRNLGKRPNVITNRFSRFLIFLHNYLPVPHRVKTAARAVFFSRILGKWENVKLPTGKTPQSLDGRLDSNKTCG